MEEVIIVVSEENMKVIDAPEYRNDLTEHFENMPALAAPLLKEAQLVFKKIEKMLYTTPSIMLLGEELIPLQDIRLWLEYYRLMDRHEKVQMIERAMRQPNSCFSKERNRTAHEQQIR